MNSNITSETLNKLFKGIHKTKGKKDKIKSYQIYLPIVPILFIYKKNKNIDKNNDEFFDATLSINVED